jgi:RNA polymerase sigma-70 factor (ECF subfamily)
LQRQAPTEQNEEWQRIQRLFQAYLEGDAAVVNSLFSTLSRIVRGFFLARTRSNADSDDLTQATLLKIHLSRHSFDVRLSIKTWVFTIAHRTLIDHWRKKSRVEPMEALDGADLASSAGESSESPIDLSNLIALRSVLEDALKTLKPLDRSIVYLGVVEGLSMAELAAVVDSTEGAIKVRMHRILRNLRGFINEADAQGERQ